MAKVSEVRTQIYFPRALHRELRRLALERDASMAELVREAVHAYLAQLAGPEHLDSRAFRDDPIWSLPDRARDFGQDDAARDHDTLLYGPDES